MTRYELQPIGSQKSFYGKAYVVRENDGTERLFSYDTEIIVRYPDGRLQRIWDGWSATTGRHIKAFCGINKKEYDKLPNTFDPFRHDEDC